MSYSNSDEQPVYFTEVPLQDCTCHKPPLTARWTTIQPAKGSQAPQPRGGHTWSDLSHTAPPHCKSWPLPLPHLVSLPLSPLCSSYDPASSSVLLFGGSTRTAEFFNDVHLFSLTSLSWSRPPLSSPAPCPRSGHTAVLHSNRLVVYGGQHIRLPTSSSSPPSLTFFSDVWLLSLPSLTWTLQPTRGALPRNGHSSFLYRDALYVLGGSDASGPQFTLLRLDLSSWVWTVVPTSGPVFHPRELHALALDPIGRLWVHGGRAEQGVLPTLHSLDLNSGRWREEGPAPARCAHALLAMPIGGIAVRRDEEEKEAVEGANAGDAGLLMIGGTDGLSFFNDVTLHTPPTERGKGSQGLCSTCNGPAHWHRLGGGNKAEVEGGEGGEGGKRAGEEEGWPAPRFAASACAVRLRSGANGVFVFGGMDEERDMGDAALLELHPS